MSDDPDNIDGLYVGASTPSEQAAASPSPPTGPLGIDPRVVWTAAGETPVSGVPAFASVVMNRVAQSGGKVSPGDIVTEPGQFPGRKQLPVGSPAYNAYESALAPYISGQTPPPYDFTAYRTHGYQSPGTPWNGSAPLTTMAGNDYATIPYKYGGSPPSSTVSDSIDDYHVTPSANADPAPPAPAPTTTPAGTAAVYDPAANVMRGPDGSVVALGNAADTKATQAPDGSYTLNVGSSTNQAAIKAWLAAHPSDPSLKPSPPVGNLGQSPGDSTWVGLTQGLGNIGATANKAALWVDQNVPGASAIDNRLLPAIGLPTPSQSVSNDLVSRLRNEGQYGSDTGYNLGKLGGEIAGTVPIMAATGGAGGALLGAASDAVPALGAATDALGALPGGNLLMRGASGALQGAEAAGITSGGSSQPLSNQLLTGAATGGALAPVGAAVNAGASRLFGAGAQAVSPFIQDLANKADQYGINLRGSQIAAYAERAAGVKNGPASIADSQLLKSPGSGYAASQSSQLQQFTRAISHTIGLDTPNLTPDAINSAFTNIGHVFDTAGARSGIAPEAVPNLSATLDQTLANANEMGLDQSQLNALNLQVGKVKDAISANDGRIPGDVYLNLSQSNSTLAKIIKNDHTAFGDAAGDVMDALHQGVADSASPEDVAALQQARTQYKALKTVQPLADKAEADGQISPLLLRQRVIQQYGNSYSRGNAGPLGDLADIGRIVGDQTSDSATPARMADWMKYGLGSGLAATEGTLLLTHPQQALQLGAGAAALAAGRYGINAFRGAQGMSPIYKNALLGGGQPQATPLMNPIANFIRPAVIPSFVAGRNLLFAPPAGVPAQ